MTLSVISDDLLLRCRWREHGRSIPEAEVSLTLSFSSFHGATRHSPRTTDLQPCVVRRSLDDKPQFG